MQKYRYAIINKERFRLCRNNEITNDLSGQLVILDSVEGYYKIQVYENGCYDIFEQIEQERIVEKMVVNEEKRNKFMEFAGKRVNNVMHDIQILEPMARSKKNKWLE